MKTTLCYSLTLIFLLTGVLTTDAQKLAHVDYQSVMMKLPERQEAEKKVQNFAKRLEKEIKQMNSEYQKRMTQFQQNQESMTQTEKQSEREKLSSLQQRITKAQQKAQQDLQSQEQELLQPMFERVDKAVQKVSKEEGYDYVFDSQNLLYTGGGKDLTPLVEKELGIGGKATGSSE